jgi:hypothetical protein
MGRPPKLRLDAEPSRRERGPGVARPAALKPRRLLTETKWRRAPQVARGRVVFVKALARQHRSQRLAEFGDRLCGPPGVRAAEHRRGGTGGRPPGVLRRGADNCSSREECPGASQGPWRVAAHSRDACQVKRLYDDKPDKCSSDERQRARGAARAPAAACPLPSMMQLNAAQRHKRQADDASAAAAAHASCDPMPSRMGLHTETPGDDRLRRGRLAGVVASRGPGRPRKTPGKTISADSHEYAFLA